MENKPKFKHHPNLRLMDLGFAKARVSVRGKGDKDRLTILPPSINTELAEHLAHVKELHEKIEGQVWV